MRKNKVVLSDEIQIKILKFLKTSSISKMIEGTKNEK